MSSFTQAVKLKPDALRSLGFGSISGVYAGVGTSFGFPVKVMFIENLTDVLLLFSFDGITDHLALPSSGYFAIDIGANKSFQQGLYIAEGTRVYVKQSGVPSTGSVYVTVFYGSNS